MFADMTPDRSRVGIETATCREADDHPNRLSLVKILRWPRRGHSCQRRDEERTKNQRSFCLHLFAPFDSKGGCGQESRKIAIHP